MLAMNSFSSEDYSHQTSMNIKKARVIDKGMSVSSYGKKWGPTQILRPHKGGTPPS